MGHQARSSFSVWIRAIACLPHPQTHVQSERHTIAPNHHAGLSRNRFACLPTCRREWLHRKALASCAGVAATLLAQLSNLPEAMILIWFLLVRRFTTLP